MFARTARLLLRPGWPEDAEQLHQAIAHETVTKNLATAPWPYRPQDAMSFLRLPARMGEASFLIFARTTSEPRLIGGIGIHPTQNGAFELGYWITPSEWGNGYATEAGKAAVGIARHALGLEKLVAGHFVDNPASGRVLHKLGFRPTGQIELRRSIARGGEVPCIEFEMVLSEDDASEGPSPFEQPMRMVA